MNSEIATLKEATPTIDDPKDVGICAGVFCLPTSEVTKSRSPGTSYSSVPFSICRTGSMSTDQASSDSAGLITIKQSGLYLVIPKIFVRPTLRSTSGLCEMSVQVSVGDIVQATHVDNVYYNTNYTSSANGQRYIGLQPLILQVTDTERTLQLNLRVGYSSCVSSYYITEASEVMIIRIGN